MTAPTLAALAAPAATPAKSNPRFGMVIDTRKCVGCMDCVVVCKTENDVPEGYCRDWITTEVRGTYPTIAMEVRSERCNHCDNPPCVSCCPTGASHVEPFGQVVHVIGSKGGVGTTTIAVNLAVSLAESAHLLSVALVDMNTLFGEIPLFMDIRPEHHWGEVEKNICRLDSHFLMNILVKHASGVYVLSSPGHLDSHQAAMPEVITQLLGFMTKVFDSDLDTCTKLQLKELIIAMGEISDQADRVSKRVNIMTLKRRV